MKTTYKHIIKTLALALLFALGSCNDWLYLEPEDGVIREDFWQSKEDVHASVIGCYASLLDGSGGGAYGIPELVFVWGEIRADMVAIGSKIRPQYSYIKTGDLLPDNNIFRWNAFYKTINNCNTVLAFSEDVRDIDPSFSLEELENYQAEALAIRSLMYFYLYRSFGDIPLVLEATKSDNTNFLIAKSPKEEVLDTIISNLELAFDKAAYSYGNANTDKGRITKYSIAAILADAYLWKEDYQKALDYCNIITASGNFALVPYSQDWFTTLFATGNSIESIFEIQFSKSKLNPYYSLYSDNRYLKAAGAKLEDVFPADPLAEIDSFDVRGENCAFSAGANFTFWKYIGINDEIARESGDSYANFIVYRYSEIMLFKAEALNHLGDGDQALSIINTLRRRANAQNTTKFLGSTSDINNVDMYILEERTRELAYEGKRWYDVLRFGRRDHYKNINIITGMIMKYAPADKVQTITAKYTDTRFHYFPIHRVELESNPNLEQNPIFEGL
jgi:hypothetical protein